MLRRIFPFVFRNKNKNKLPQIERIHLCIEPEDINEWQKTDIIINIINCPFATLTESKIPNIWYHHDERIDYLFSLGKEGFRWVKGSKNALMNRGLLR